MNEVEKKIHANLQVICPKLKGEAFDLMKFNALIVELMDESNYKHQLIEAIESVLNTLLKYSPQPTEQLKEIFSNALKVIRNKNKPIKDLNHLRLVSQQIETFRDIIVDNVNNCFTSKNMLGVFTEYDTWLTRARSRIYLQKKRIKK